MEMYVFQTLFLYLCHTFLCIFFAYVTVKKHGILQVTEPGGPANAHNDHSRSQLHVNFMLVVARWVPLTPNFLKFNLKTMKSLHAFFWIPTLCNQYPY